MPVINYDKKFIKKSGSNTRLPFDSANGQEIRDLWPQDFLDNVWPHVNLISVVPNDYINSYINEYKEFPDDADIFKQFDITNKQIKSLRENPNSFFLSNLVYEGATAGYPYNGHNYFSVLTNSGKRHGIPGEKIFHITSNLHEEQNYELWQNKNSPDYKINVITINIFEVYHDFDQKCISIDQTVDKIKRLSDKYFLCLNRRVRPLRVVSLYKMFKSSILPNTIMSYDKLAENIPQRAYEYLHGDISKLDSEIVKKLIDSSPCIIDRTDFETDWNQITFIERDVNVLMSIVHETLHESYNGTNIFITEKTLRPMLANHPIIVIGQPGANTKLPLMGYKTYDAYFDLSFDTVENHFERLDLQIHQLEELNEKFKSMTSDQRIKWLLQDVETLEHNKNLLKEHNYFKQGLTKFINKIKELINIQ